MSSVEHYFQQNQILENTSAYVASIFKLQFNEAIFLTILSKVETQDYTSFYKYFRTTLPELKIIHYVKRLTYLKNV